MRHIWLVAALVVVLVPTSAQAGNGNGNGNGNANGSQNGKSNGRDNGTKDDTGAGGGSGGSGSSSTGSGGGGPVLSPEGAADTSDQDVALDAVTSGRALPLVDIANRVRSLFSARVLDAHLIERGTQLIYRLTILTDAGVSKQVDIDAKAGTVMRAH